MEESERWMQRACVVVNRMGPDEEAETVVESVAQEMGAQYAHILWYWTDDTPDWVAVAAADQLRAHRRDAGPDAVYLVVEVYELGRDTIEGFTDSSN